METNVKKYDNLTSDTWLYDSAVNCHSTHDLDGVYDIEEVQEMAIVGNDNGIQIMIKRKLNQNHNCMER